MRFFLCFLAALSAVPASAERLTLDRIHADPALAGPGVRNLSVSPDGEHIMRNWLSKPAARTKSVGI